MEELLEKISEIGVNLDTDSLVKVAQYWFWKSVASNLVITGIVAMIIITGFIVARNYGMGKWN